MDMVTLKNIFPSLVTVENKDDMSLSEYEWFEAEDGTVFGIKESELNKKESTLLKALLKKAHLSERPLSEREKVWSEILFQGQTHSLDIEKYRFIFYHFKKAITEPEMFDEAIKALSPYAMSIIWTAPTNGVIIEEIHKENQQPAQFGEIVDVITSDLYVQVLFFVSEFISEISDGSILYHWYKKIADMSFDMKNKGVSYLADALPPFLVDQLKGQSKALFVDNLFKSVKDDKELLQTVRIFLECNSNMTEAAKKLYMHRNSLQYRIEKFIELTGIDIKTFHGGLTTYLALLMLD